MAHTQQFDFVQKVKLKYPTFFFQKKVLEVGSLNINGSVRDFFSYCNYLGIDVGPGPCVDLVCQGQVLDHPDNTYDVSLSCEYFEHNPYWVETFQNMYRMTTSGGLVFMTCATTGRPEHGTTRSDPVSSPLTIGIGWDYYKNLTEQDFRDSFDIDEMFSEYKFEVGTPHEDLYFYGIKKVSDVVNFRKYFIKKYYDSNWLKEAKESYDNADPYPHLVIDNFLPVDVLNRVVDNFPKPNELDWWVFNDNNEIKLGSKKEMQLPQVARNVCQELNSGYVLDWLESLTGVPGLIADTRLFGGGLHQIVSGGKLGIHVDFNIEPHTKLRRRLNFLIYLNKDWQDEWEGHLELWDVNKTKCVKRIAPEFNRAVIFNTNDSSWHGHPIPLKTPEHITRKSLALYYYNVDTENVKVRSTIY